MRSVSVPQADVLDCSWQTLGLVALAVRRNLCKVLFADGRSSGCCYWTRHCNNRSSNSGQIPDFLLDCIRANFRSHIIHIDMDLSRTWQRTGYQQNRRMKRTFRLMMNSRRSSSSLRRAHPPAAQPSHLLADGIGTTLSSSRCFSGVIRYPQIPGGSG